MKIGIYGAGSAGLSAAFLLRSKFPDLQIYAQTKSQCDQLIGTIENRMTSA